MRTSRSCSRRAARPETQREPAGARRRLVEHPGHALPSSRRVERSVILGEAQRATSTPTQRRPPARRTEGRV